MVNNKLKIFAVCLAILASAGLSAQIRMVKPRLREPAALELPRTDAGDIIVRHPGHVLCYNPDWMIPNWVAYELKAEELDGNAERERYFSPDPALEQYERAEHWHYTHSGWVRGHMIPAGDLKYDQEAMTASFYTSNICPMNMTFNNSIWKRLEEKVRKLAYEFGRVYIITGPVMGENQYGKVGESNIFVPDGFFKAILVPKGNSYLAAGFLMPNSEDAQGKLRDYVMTVDDLEDLVGMDLFFSLSPAVAREVEAALPLKELGLY